MRISALTKEERVTYTLRKNGLTTDVEIIVSTDSACELWSVKVKNNSTDTRQISIVGFCGSGFDEEYTRQGYNMAVADIDDSLGAIVTSRYAEFEKVGKRLIYSFMALSENTDAYDCTYNSVIGPYGSFAHSVPAAVVDHRDDVAMQEILIGVGAGLSKRDLT